MKTAVITFPGTNREKDLIDVLRADGDEVHKVFHKKATLPKSLDAIFIPGGFSYGDYLRAGASAIHSPIMAEVIKAAQRGVMVVGICNGFQILCEAGLLEGSLSRNRDVKFTCNHAYLKIEDSNSPFSKKYIKKSVIQIPIANMDGNFYAPDEVLKKLEGEGQVLFRYCDKDGSVAEDANPNGSCNNIAGITNSTGNVLGFMPHPENACLPHQLSQDGRLLFGLLRQSLKVIDLDSRRKKLEQFEFMLPPKYSTQQKYRANQDTSISLKAL